MGGVYLAKDGLIGHRGCLDARAAIGVGGRERRQDRRYGVLDVVAAFNAAESGDTVELLQNATSNRIAVVADNIVGGMFGGAQNYGVLIFDNNAFAGAATGDQAVELSVSGGSFAGFLGSAEVLHLQSANQKLISGGTANLDGVVVGLADNQEFSSLVDNATLEGEVSTVFTVVAEFVERGSVADDADSVVKEFGPNEVIVPPDDPTREGYTFGFGLFLWATSSSVRESRSCSPIFFAAPLDHGKVSIGSDSIDDDPVLPTRKRYVKGGLP